LDIVLSVAGVICLLPLAIVVAIVIVRDSPGPVLVRVPALKKPGIAFGMWKFRTMRKDAGGYFDRHPDEYHEFRKSFKLQLDPRVTRVGRMLRRTSINELPQLLNVLAGDMSLVGPRTIAPDEVGRYGPTYIQMLSVPVGMTGLWQVSGRHTTSYETRVQLDMHYIENRSLLLDLAILLRTVGALVSMRGAY
jgi:lipopolysaccharide/colanic/teichoic acid biosynthesis glycosyltransferase